MIKKIMQIADIHVRNFIRHEEYGEQLEKLIEKCQKEMEGLEYHEGRILICGDLVHSKNNISNELIMFVSAFMRELEKIAPVIVYSGNHDLLITNMSRTDTLTALFSSAQFKNVSFLDQMLGYESGIVIDENVIWCLYSIHDNYRKPENISDTKSNNPNAVTIGLYHGTIVGAQLNNGSVIENGMHGDMFAECDYVMAGDIHMHQEFYRGDTLIVYSGSLIQQTFGETVTQHGFVSWDLEAKTHEFIEIDNEYSLYDFEINSIEDIDNDTEKLRNY
jgi:DNA repair exonuclease SbcCD nuclease subunit